MIKLQKKNIKICYTILILKLKFQKKNEKKNFTYINNI